MDALHQLAAALAKLPGIGRRTAERLAVHLARNPTSVAHDVAAALDTARRELTACQQCGSVTPKTENPCRLCADARRDNTILCVVEDPADIALIERSGEYHGRYFALMGKISPLRGEGLGDLRLPALLERAATMQEVLLALNSDVESDATASYLRHVLAQKYPQLKITRLALGIPAGSAIAFSDPVTLGRAIRGRTS
ncbi:MAG TPA: recombination mediator RecR [Kiritimatiellia bacterium]|jgi:recombination protein RecR|nr:recombination protein RecR [Kiritimatiellia bacterium]OQC59500.1 MAG: Recombination protein RecR [Verrucomicrobia bacterium ADurb.Bin018]HOD99907.1 recombination mediator RecR [Kiritimatiellia bacterium]HOE37520.1 recombination mediator RecR [Kiritimatiellia bacterium]HOR75022.1 recombination mediator RecR [Kiritimatiellia bacterium]